MTPLRHFLTAMFGLLLLAVVGTGGYAWIEGGTVGFSEVQPLSPGGQWSTVLILGFVVAGISAFVIKGELRALFKGHRLDRQILQLSGHILCVCGAGGRETAGAGA